MFITLSDLRGMELNHRIEFLKVTVDPKAQLISWMRGNWWIFWMILITSQLMKTRTVTGCLLVMSHGSKYFFFIIWNGSKYFICYFLIVWKKKYTWINTNKMFLFYFCFPIIFVSWNFQDVCWIMQETAYNEGQRSCWTWWASQITSTTIT